MKPSSSKFFFLFFDVSEKKKKQKASGASACSLSDSRKVGRFLREAMVEAMEWLPRVGRERREENSGGRGSRELEMSERRAKSADGTDFERALFFSLSLSFVTFASF